MKKRILLFLFVTLFALSHFDSFAADNLSGKEFTDPSEFDGKKIGTLTGSVYDKVILELFEDAKPYYFLSLSDALYALKKDKIDCVIYDDTYLPFVSESLGEDYEYSVLEGKGNEIAFIGGKTEKGERLMAEFSAYIRKCREDGSLQELIETMMLGSEDQRTISQWKDLPNINGELILATSPEGAPVEYIKDGELCGFEIELATRFCKEMGYKPVFQITNFAGILTGVGSNVYDIGLCNLVVTEERRKAVCFSDPIYLSYYGIIYKKGSIEAGPESETFLGKLKYGLQTTFINENRWKTLLSGFGVTVLISVCSCLLGTFLGFGMHLLCRKEDSLRKKVSGVSRWLIHGMPEVVFLMIMFYIVFANLKINGVVISIITFSLTFACMYHGMLETGEKSISREQTKAIEALGYEESKGYYKIILPQTLRIIISPYLEAISTHVKATAIVGYIAVVDLTKAGDLIRGRTYEAIIPLISVVIGYYVMEVVLHRLAKWAVSMQDYRTRTPEKILRGADKE